MKHKTLMASMIVHPNRIIALESIRNEVLTLDKVREYFKEFEKDKVVVFWLCRNQGVTGEVLKEIYESKHGKNASMLYNIISNKNCPVEILTEILKKDDEDLNKIAEERLQQLKKESFDIWKK